MPSSDGHYAFIFIGDTFIARQQQVSAGTNIACWEDSDWGADSLVERRTICNNVSIEIGSVTTNCTSDVPDCCDECGTCDADVSNDCVQDCEGVWDGDSVLDNCGTCDDDSSNDCVQDCAGTWGGSAMEDACGICNGDGTACIGCTNDTDCNGHGSCQANTAITIGNVTPAQLCHCDIGFTADYSCTANTCNTISNPMQYQQLGCCDC